MFSTILSQNVKRGAITVENSPDNPAEELLYLSMFW